MTEKETGKTSIFRRFSEASSKKDLDSIQDILLSPSEDTDALHREIWNAADPENSRKYTREAFSRFRTAVRPAWTRFAAVTSVVSSAACAVLAVMLLTGKYGPEDDAAPVEIEWTEQRTSACEIRELTLPDGTHIWMNAESSIFYPETFTGKNRKVFASGELFLEVAKDTLHPFILQSGESTVTVTGTRFNVKSYGDTFSAVLVEGGIDVAVDRKTFSLVSGEMISWDRENGDVRIDRIRQNRFPAWYKGEFNSYDETFENIAKDLERRFGVEIIIRDESVAQERFSVSFVNGESLESILSALNIGDRFQIRRSGDVIDIF